MGTIYLIGLGLGTLAQVNSEAFEAAEKVDELYLDTYTSFLERSLLDELKKRFSEKLIEADRGLLEEDISEIVSKARDKDIGILVPGDPMIATTHLSIMVEAAKKNISCKIIHGTSAYCAVISASCLHAYKFGRTTTIPKSGVGVETCYRVIAENMERGLHSLILLDTADGGLAIPEALEFLLKVEEKLGLGIFSENLLVICLARIGFMDEFKWAGKMRNALTNPYPPPPHSIVIPGELHFSEAEALKTILRADPTAVDEHKPARHWKSRIEKYLKNVENVLRSLSFCSDERESRDLVDVAKSYLEDSRHFRSSGDLFNALAAISYAEGLLDALRELRKVEFTWKPDSR